MPRVNTKKAINQRVNKGMTLQEIADNQGVSKSAIHYALQRVNDPRLLEAYKSNRADILAGLQGEILNSIEPEDIKKASLLQRITSVGVLFDKERLERNQAVEIVDIRSLNLDLSLDKLRQEREALEGKIVDI